MDPMWLALIVASVGAYGLKLAGVALPTRILEKPRVRRVASLLPVAMLTALVVVELFDDGGGTYGWDPAVVAGVAAGGIAVRFRQGVLTVFIVAVATTALLRWLF